jgi:imidazolonepropionase-like amidohydrolase
VRIPRALKIGAAVLALGAAALGVHLRIALGPELPTPPLVTAAPAPPAIFFHDVAVFTGEGPASLAHQDVLVRGEAIVSIAPTGAAAPEGAEIVEGAGRTLLPGFIDAHTHVSGSGAPPWAPARVTDEHELEAYVYAGITSTFVLGGLAPALAGLDRKAAEGALIGPRLYFTHLPITAPGGHPLVVGKELMPFPLGALVAAMIPTASDAASAERAVAGTTKHPVSFVKAMVDHLPPSAPAMEEATLRAIVEASHRAGKKVFVHVGSADDALVAVRAGADVLAHGVYRGEITAEQAAEIARRKVPVIFTLAGWVRTAQLAHGTFRPSALDEATVPRPILDSLRGEAGRAFAAKGALAEFVHGLLESEPHWLGNVRRLREAGVTLLVGTDSPLPAIFPGSSFHAEMELLAEAGVPPAEILLGATSRAADVLALPQGRVAAGRPADLVLVRGDPTARLADAAEIERVVLRGRVVKRAR